MLQVVHHPAYVGPAPVGSGLACDKYGLVLEALRATGKILDIHHPVEMPQAWIEAVHDPADVAEVLELAVPREKERRIGFPVTAHVRRRSLLSVGGTWAAARLALTHGYAANLAGGSHHALRDTGAGYCVFNDLAIASHRLLAEGSCTRILIVDLDVHQGDGTELLTADQPAIFTLSSMPRGISRRGSSRRPSTFLSPTGPRTTPISQRSPTCCPERWKRFGRTSFFTRPGWMRIATIGSAGSP